jgi:hypothetical protein
MTDPPRRYTADIRTDNLTITVRSGDSTPPAVEIELAADSADGDTMVVIRRDLAEGTALQLIKALTGALYQSRADAARRGWTDDTEPQETP